MSVIITLKELRHDIFSHFCGDKKLPLIRTKPLNNNLLTRISNVKLEHVRLNYSTDAKP